MVVKVDPQITKKVKIERYRINVHLFIYYYYTTHSIKK